MEKVGTHKKMIVSGWVPNGRADASPDLVAGFVHEGVSSGNTWPSGRVQSYDGYRYRYREFLALKVQGTRLWCI